MEKLSLTSVLCLHRTENKFIGLIPVGNGEVGRVKNLRVHAHMQLCRATHSSDDGDVSLVFSIEIVHCTTHHIGLYDNPPLFSRLSSLPFPG